MGTARASLARRSAWASTVAHEIGHYLGLYHHHDPGLPDANPGIEGFLNDGAASLNKSAVEGNGGSGSNVLRSLMQPMAMQTGLREQFILNGQYKALVDDIDRHGMPSQAGILRNDARTLLALLGDPAHRGNASASLLAGSIVRAAEAQDEGVLVVRGWLASGGVAGILEPVEWQPGATPIQVPVAADLASIRFLGSAGQTLAAAPIAASAPGWSLTRSSGDDRTIENAPMSFSVTLPRVRGAHTLELVSATGTVLEQVAASASPLTVRLVSPASGTPWSPGTPITWHASDADGGR